MPRVPGMAAEKQAAEIKERLLTTAQAAEILNCTRKTVWSWAKSGQLRAIRIGRRYVRIPQSEINRILQG